MVFRRLLLLRSSLDKESGLILVSIVLLCTFYMIGFYRSQITCERSYNWTDELPNLRSLIVNTVPLSNPACISTPVFLLIIICSSATNFAARQSIRQTWGKRTKLSPNTQLFFLIGRSSDFIGDNFIFDEKQDYGDIIHYDFADTYFNLTLKSVLMLHYLRNSCWRPKYILKVDDDTFVNVKNLENDLLVLKEGKHMIGCLMEGALPDQDICSKWYVPTKFYPDNSYPNYLSGSGYVLSYDVVALLYETSLFMPFYPFEDIFITGLCAASSGLVPRNHEGFSYRRPRFESCYLKKIVTAHRVTPREQFLIWDKVNDPTTDCS